MPADSRAIAAINADFFLFAPPGVPTNLHLEHGRVVAGPGGRPVFATDGAGRYVLDTIRAEGTITGRERALQLRAWNRPDSGRSGIVDGNWGVPLDSAIRRGVQRLDPSAVTGRGTEIAGRYVVRASTPADTLVHGDTLLLHLADGVPPLPPGDTVLLSLRLAGAAGIALREAVGGRPLLVADSAVTGDVDTEGNAGFRGLNPRSAVGMNRQGTRIWFAVIDGRRPGYSMGMTLRQTAELMRALGATRALNLDGGGSSALALRDPVAGRDQRETDEGARPRAPAVGGAPAGDLHDHVHHELHGREEAGANDPKGVHARRPRAAASTGNLHSSTAMNRTRSPGASTAGGSRRNSKSAAGDRPMSRHPPGPDSG